MKARYYDPEIGRFYSGDPVGFSSGNQFSFNRYAYANNNPYKFVDPDGRFATQIVGAVFGAGFELTSQIGMQMAINGGDFSKVDIEWVDVGTMAAVGAITSGLGVTVGKAFTGAKNANKARKKYNMMSTKISQKSKINQKQRNKMERFQEKASIEKTKIKDIAKQQAEIAAAKAVIKESVNDSDVNNGVEAVITVVKAP